MIHLYAATETATPDNKTMTEQANESGEKLSETQRLAAIVHDLNRSIGRWSNGYMVLVALTVLLAGAVFVAQFVISKKQQDLSKAQDDLIAEKDRVSKIDSDAKDERIAVAQQKAAEANQKAEEERLARLKIEERMGGWRLSENAQERVAKALLPFAGTQFSLVANPTEAEFVATINRILVKSGWVLVLSVDTNGNHPTVRLDEIAGIVFSSGLKVTVSEDQYALLSPAAAAYKQSLIAEGVDVKLIMAKFPASKVAPDVVRIEIGKRE